MTAETTGAGARTRAVERRRHRPGGAVVLANGLVTVVVDPADGTFAVDGLAGFGPLVDGGDLGRLVQLLAARQRLASSTPPRR